MHLNHCGSQVDFMKQNLLNQGVLIENFSGVGPATRATARERARELCAMAGRRPEQVTQADYERVKRKSTDASDVGRQDALLDGPRNPSAGIPLRVRKGGKP